MYCVQVSFDCTLEVYRIVLLYVGLEAICIALNDSRVFYETTVIFCTCRLIVSAYVVVACDRACIGVSRRAVHVLQADIVSM